MASALTHQQKLFCEAYVVSRNAMQSAIEAGYTDTYAKSKSYLLMKDPKIIEYINELEEKFYNENLSRLAYESVGVLEEILREGYDDRVRLAAVKEILKLSGIEQKLEQKIRPKEEGTSNNNIQIVFNEVASRET